MEHAQAIGEVIASSTRKVVAEVLQGQEMPAFGSWVRVQGADRRWIYGVVSLITSESMEPGRMPVALGLQREVLRREMPHVLELIRTTFEVIVLAYQEVGKPVRQTLPPYPPHLHDLVFPVPPDTLRELGEPFDYLRLLVQHSETAVPVDELLVALLERLAAAQLGPSDAGEMLLKAGRILSRLFGDDHERLQAILRRVEVKK